MVDATNVATLLDAYADRGDKARNAATNIADLLAKQAEIERVSADGLKGIADDAAAVSSVAGLGLLAAQDATQSAVRLMEGNTRDPNGLKSQQMGEFVARKREADGLLADIKEKASVSFFDNPLAYIMNQMDLPRLQTNYNLTATQANSALRTVNAIDSTLTNEAQANKATAVTQTTASVAAASRIAANSYTLQANEMEYKALGLQIQANTVIDHGNATQVDMLHKQYEVLNNEEIRKRQALEYDIQKRRFDQWEQEHKDTQEGKAYVRNLIQTGMGVLGMRKPDESTIFQYEQAYKTPEGRKQMQEIIEAGQRKLFTGLGVVGTSPADTFYTVAKVGDYSQGKEYAPALAAITDEARKLASGPNRMDPMKPGTFTPALNAAMETKKKEWNINPENSPIYKAPTMERMAQIDIVRETPWFTQIVAPSIVAAKAAGATVPPITARELYKQTVDAVDKGTLTVEQASIGIATYYGMATKVNSLRNGIVGIGPQEGYKVPLGASNFGDSVDFTRPEQITAALLQNTQLQINDLIRGTGVGKHVQFWTGYKVPDQEGAK